MKEKAPHKWGGLKRRYETNSLSELRFRDPVANVPLAVGLDHVFESWLRYRFDPNVVSIGIGDGAVNREVDGPARAAEVHLDIRYASGERILEFVARRPLPARRSRALDALARANLARGFVRLRSDLRDEARLTSNLRLLRQRMQMHRTAAANEQLQQHLESFDSTTRGAFAAGLAGQPSAYIDAFLGFMHCKGVIHLQLSGAPYGDQTRFFHAR